MTTHDTLYYVGKSLEYQKANMVMTTYMLHYNDGIQR